VASAGDCQLVAASTYTRHTTHREAQRGLADTRYSSRCSARVETTLNSICWIMLESHGFALHGTGRFFPDSGRGVTIIRCAYPRTVGRLTVIAKLFQAPYVHAVLAFHFGISIFLGFACTFITALDTNFVPVARFVQSSHSSSDTLS